MRFLIYTLFLLLTLVSTVSAQKTISGRVVDAVTGETLIAASVKVVDQEIGTVTDENGQFMLKVSAKARQIIIEYTSYKTETFDIGVDKTYALQSEESILQEVVVSGTLKEATKMNSPIPIEVYTPTFFRRNPSPSLFTALENVNGVRPQLNCNVCNTGDIHINGMEGPYTMILIDGMPIVSSLSTVYGLMGIPNSLVQRIEVVKGPASTLYGSEAVGGIINVITKNPVMAPNFSLDIHGSDYQDVNIDLAKKWNLAKWTTILSANVFHFDKRWDINNDNFTDITLQKRASLFNKWHLTRDNNKESSLGIRYVWENRWGGEMDYEPEYRLGDSIYGESILTNRLEAIGRYDLPTKEKLRLMYSFNTHHQNSAYGTTSYIAIQRIGFGQLVWDKNIRNHSLLLGAAYRYTFYDDNTPITADPEMTSINKPSHIHLPGLFVQDEIKLSKPSTILMGVRYDYNNLHGNVLSPRVNYRWSPNDFHTMRLGFGNGFRVANVFSEDHAALTGAREVVIAESLQPERSYNVNINHTAKWFPSIGVARFDASVFYTYFSNRIVADFFTDADKVIYDNLDGHGVSKGITLETELSTTGGFRYLIGATLMDVYTVESGQKLTQVQTPKTTCNWSVSYQWAKVGINVDYTGTLYSPMLLPVVPNDYRPSESHWFSHQNMQATKTFKGGWEVYTGIKNLLNFLPEDPILRPFDPFDKNINVNNPEGFTFDPNYNYAPIQARRFFLGVRFEIK